MVGKRTQRASGTDIGLRPQDLIRGRTGASAPTPAGWGGRLSYAPSTAETTRSVGAG